MQTEELQKKIGGEIKKLRLINEWTQEQVAEQLFIGRDAYGDIERGKTDISLSRLIQVANFFGVEVAQLFDSPPCATSHTYTQSNNRIRSRYNQCQFHSAEENLQHELEKSELTVTHLRQQVDDKQKVIDVLEAARVS
jgi:transcriptional regulator with XRE-family HTH domain